MKGLYSLTDLETELSKKHVSISKAINDKQKNIKESIEAMSIYNKWDKRQSKHLRYLYIVFLYNIKQ